MYKTYIELTNTTYENILILDTCWGFYLHSRDGVFFTNRVFRTQIHFHNCIVECRTLLDLSSIKYKTQKFNLAYLLGEIWDLGLL